jgi:hypothetical protein
MREPSARMAPAPDSSGTPFHREHQIGHLTSHRGRTLARHQQHAVSENDAGSAGHGHTDDSPVRPHGRSTDVRARGARDGSAVASARARLDSPRIEAVVVALLNDLTALKLEKHAESRPHLASG